MSLVHINKPDLREANLTSGFREKSRTDITGKRTQHNIAIHRNEYLPSDEVVVDVPRFGAEDVLVQDSLNFCFDFSLGSNTKSWFRNNLSRILQSRLEIQMEGQKIYENPKESFFEVYSDLWRSNEVRQNSHQFGICNLITRKLICGSDDGASSGSDGKANEEYDSQAEN